MPRSATPNIYPTSRSYSASGGTADPFAQRKSVCRTARIRPPFEAIYL